MVYINYYNNNGLFIFTDSDPIPVCVSWGVGILFHAVSKVLHIIM